MRSTLFILWLLSAIPVYAQSDSLHIYSMQEVYQQNNWLTGANPVGMLFNRFRSFSVAEVGYRFEDGNFGNVSLPASSNKYAVFGESYQTIGNVSLYGGTPPYLLTEPLPALYAARASVTLPL